MGSLLMRRQLMVPAAVAPAPSWDIDWDYTKGLPSANGWTTTTAGTASETLRDTDLRVYAKNSSSYVRYAGQTCSTGVLEAEFELTSNYNNNAMFLCYDSTFRIGVRAQYSSNYKGIYLYTSTSIGSMQKLLTVSQSTKYKVRLVLDGTYGYVYINDVLKADQVDPSSMAGSNDSTFFSVSSSASGTSNAYTNLYSLKQRVGSI